MNPFRYLAYRFRCLMHGRTREDWVRRQTAAGESLGKYMAPDPTPFSKN